MTELWRRPAEELARQFKAGEIGAREILDAHLERLQSVDAEVCAYLSVFSEEARQQAETLERRRAAGEELGPLAAVPVAIKDNQSVAGRGMSCGSRILEGYTAPYDATAVRRIRDADAVIVGKTNLDEFSMGSSCENSALATTRNPWHLGRVPGGSSGGSAASVAAGSVPLALGSDTGGSIRQPAAFCGLVGVKPTYGRVSRYGLVAFASSLDQIGPMTRTVRDAALALGVISGADPHDSTCAPLEREDFLAGIEEGIEGLRIGILDEVNTSTLPEDETADWQASLERLESLGAELRRVSVPNLPATVAAYYVVANSEASANLARFDGVRYGRRDPDALSLDDVYSGSRSQGFGAEVKRRIMLGTFALSSGYHDQYYGRAVGVIATLKAQFARVFEKVDVLVTPTTPSPAFEIGEKTGDPLSMYLSDVFTTPASLAGLPAVAVPSGLDSAGLPLSLQVIGRPFEEAMVLRVARAFESASDFACRPSFVAAQPEAGT